MCLIVQEAAFTVLARIEYAAIQIDTKYMLLMVWSDVVEKMTERLEAVEHELRGLEMKRYQRRSFEGVLI